MEDLISNFSKTLAPFCNHLQNTSDALKHSMDRRPIPLDSASSTFIQSLNRRVSAVNVDLNFLESMSLETVSFEELLGHVSEVYKKNETDLLELQKQLKGVGYVPEFEVDEDDEILNNVSTPGLHFELSSSMDGLNVSSSYQKSVSTTGLAKHSFEDDILLDDSLSLQNAGLSDVCLATLASEGNSTFSDPYEDLHTPKKFLEKPLGSNFPCQSAAQTVGAPEGEGEDHLTFKEPISPLITLSKDDFESLPSYMKGLASWEDLIVAAEKINSCLGMKGKGKNYILQDEISSLDLGPKARSFLLLLVRMKRVLVETIEGQISYRVL
uniref:Spindle and kinetochore-associated protein 3 n=1 Tax=Cucumis melo TaxID=3656 RepID=A0A9I9CWE0_CUCME